MSLWGTNNCDHQARICHSTTVAGVANTWGYGAMTNSYNDMQNAKAALYIGSNAAEAHPVSMLHMLHAKENGCQDDRGRPSLHAHGGQGRPVRATSARARTSRSCSACCTTSSRTAGKTRSTSRTASTAWRRSARKCWPSGRPTRCSKVSGVDRGQQVYKVAKTMAENRPSTIVWCMGQTQHTTGNAMVRASCILQLALGNIGVRRRWHQHLPRPRQRAGRHRRRPEPGFAAGLLRHRPKAPGQALGQGVERRLRVAQEAVRLRGMMTKPGMTVSRWIDGVLEKNELIDQDSNLRGMVFWGHAPNSQTRGLEMKKAMEKLDLMVVVIDPYPERHGGHGGDARQGRGPEPEPCRLPAAGHHAVRDERLVRRPPTAPSSGASRSSSRCSSPAPTT